MSLSDRYMDWKNLCVNKVLFNVVFSQKNMLLIAKFIIFLCCVISQGKVVALDRWGVKWNHLSMTHRLTSICAKNYCNRTLIVKVIIENVVTFWGTKSTVWVKKIPPKGSDIFSFFHKRLRIFNGFFTHLLYVPMYTRSQICI